MTAESAFLPSAVQLMRYSAATGNSHRLHYDQAYAQANGYSDVLVQLPLQCAWLLRACRRVPGWPRDPGALRSFTTQARRPWAAGETAVVRATSTEPVGGQLRVVMELVDRFGAVLTVGQCAAAGPLDADVLRSC